MKSKKFDSYLFSQSIATTATGSKKMGLYDELVSPMTIQRMVALEKKVNFFINKMEKSYKPDKKYGDDADAMQYFISYVHSTVMRKSGSPEYKSFPYEIEKVSGYFEDKNARFTDVEVLANFNHLVERWLGDLAYFSDRWCYSRFFCFKMTWLLVKSRWRQYQYRLKHPEHFKN
jgi:hypothetical protein